MLSKLIFLILIKITLTVNPKKDSDTASPVPDITDLKKPMVRVEFIEEVSDQTYLQYLHEDEIYTLDLYNFSETLKSNDLNSNPDGQLECPKAIFENFRLKSYFSPFTVSVPVNECPTMKSTCCSEGDMVLLRETWEFKYNKYLKFNQYYFKYYVMTILKQHEMISKVAGMVVDVAKDRHCAKVAEKLLAFKINDQYIKMVEDLIDGFIDYDQRLKHSFICFFCDYESIKFWDIEGQTVAFNYKFCNSMVENTLDYYHLMNSEIYKYINTANFLTKCVNFQDPNSMGKMNVNDTKSSEFLEVDNSMYLHQCKLAKDKKKNLYNNCLNFCSKFDMWYPSRPMYRSSFQLAEIFGNLKDKIFKDNLKYDVTEPGSINRILPLFEVTYPDKDIFKNFDRVFIDRGGIKPETLLSAVHY